MKKLSPVVVVPSVEQALSFWCEVLGFDKVAEVPHGDALGFVILRRGDAEVMLQSADSVREDLGAAFAPASSGYEGVLLYAEVDSVEALVDGAGEQLDIVVGPRTTFYGMHEVWVRTPEGLVVGLASRAASASDA